MLRNFKKNILFFLLIFSFNFFQVVYGKNDKANYLLLNYEKAIDLHSARDLKTTVNYLNSALKINPNDISTLVKLASVYIQLSEPNSAIPLLKRASVLASDDAHVFLLLGIAYKQNSQFDDAIKSFEKSIKLEPENSLVHINAGLICSKITNNQCAIENLEKSVLAYPDALQAQCALAKTYQLNKQYSLAENHYRQLLSYEPENTSILYNLSKTILAQGKNNEAIEILNKAISIDSNFVELYLDRAKAYYEMNKLEDAESNYLEALKIDPTNPEIYVEHGSFLQKTGAYSQAADEYKKAIVLQPNDIELVTSCAYLLQVSNRLKEASEYWNEVLKLDAENEIALFNLGKLSQDKNDFTSAIEYYKRVSSSLEEKRNLSAVKGLAYSYHKNKDYDTAKNLYEELIKANPDDIFTPYNLGVLLNEKNDYAQAVQNFEKALSLNFPHKKLVYSELLKAYEKLNDNINLDLTYKKLLEEDKENIEDRIAYANFLKKQGNIKDAVNQFIVASTLDSTEKSKLKLAKFLIEQNDLFGAVDELQEYLHAFPNDLEAIKLLAKAYQDLNIHESAISMYKKILEHERGNHTAYYNLGVLYQKIEKNDDAKNNLLKAIELNENFAPAYYAIGTSYLSEKSPDKAKEYFEKYLKLEPNGEYRESIETKLKEIANGDKATNKENTNKHG